MVWLTNLLSEYSMDSLANETGALSEKERALATFFARLASIPSPVDAVPFRFEDSVWRQIRRELRKELRGVEPEELAEAVRARSSGFDRLPIRVRKELERDFARLTAYQKLVERFGDPDGAYLRRELSRLHRTVRKCLLELFEGQAVSLHNLNTVAPSVRFKLEDGVLHEASDPADTDLGANDFVRILRLKPFPFRRCPQCGAFFVWTKRQRYCSKPCASQFLEAQRKGKRREYMRKLMAIRRQRERRRSEGDE